MNAQTSPAPAIGDDPLAELERLAEIFKQIAQNGQACTDPTRAPYSETSHQLQDFLWEGLLAPYKRSYQCALLEAFQTALVKSYTNGIDHDQEPFEAMRHALNKTAIRIGAAEAQGWYLLSRHGA